MRMRTLGHEGLEVSEIGLGCMGMTGAYGRPDDDESTATIRRALDLGITLLDTADTYGGGDNERLVGKAIRSRRDEVVLASKFGIVSFQAQGKVQAAISYQPTALPPLGLNLTCQITRGHLQHARLPFPLENLEIGLSLVNDPPLQETSAAVPSATIARSSSAACSGAWG